MSPVDIECDIKEKTKLRIRIDTVSSVSWLVIKVNGKEALDQKFVCGPGKGDWKKEVYNKEYSIYQNIYEKDYFCDIPAGTRRIEIQNTEGDWLTFSELEISKAVLRPSSNWGVKQDKVIFDRSDTAVPFKTAVMVDREYMWRENILSWKKLEAMGSGVIVGEWGAFCHTPHDVTLRWMKDCLENWKKANWGWALWNFRGEFGILDSNRRDVKYEDFQGHKLDKKMLELLQTY